MIFPLYAVWCNSFSGFKYFLNTFAILIDFFKLGIAESWASWRLYDCCWLLILGPSEIKTEDSKPTEALELLQANAQLIDQLKIVQNERLSGTPPAHFSQLQKPTEKETELAANIQSNLVEMVGQVKPNQVLPEAAIRAVMGIKAPLPQEAMDVE